MKPKAAAKPATIRVMSLNTWSDGTAAEFLRPFGYPAEWKEHECRDIPERLVQEFTGMGARLTTDAAQMEPWEHLQKGFARRNAEWQAEQAAKEQRTRAADIEYRINQEVQRLLAAEQAEHLAQLRSLAKRNLGL